jgi:cysteine desulfurase
MNVPAIAAMTDAAQRIHNQIRSDFAQFQLMPKTLLNELNSIIGYVKIYQTQENLQLPSIKGISIAGLEGQWDSGWIEPCQSIVKKFKTVSN